MMSHASSLLRKTKPNSLSTKSLAHSNHSLLSKRSFATAETKQPATTTNNNSNGNVEVSRDGRHGHHLRRKRNEPHYNNHLSPFGSFFDHPHGFFSDAFPFGRNGLMNTPSVFDRAFKNFDSFMEESQSLDPKVNLFSTKDGWTVEAELAGIPKEDVQIEIEDGVLTIKGEKKVNKEEEDEGKVYSRKETFHGTFSRSFGLPDDVDTSNVKANFQDGMLRIKLGKKEGATETSEDQYRIRKLDPLRHGT